MLKLNNKIKEIKTAITNDLQFLSEVLESDQVDHSTKLTAYAVFDQLSKNTKSLTQSFQNDLRIQAINSDYTNFKTTSIDGKIKCTVIKPKDKVELSKNANIGDLIKCPYFETLIEEQVKYKLTKDAPKIIESMETNQDLWKTSITTKPQTPRILLTVEND